MKAVPNTLSVNVINKKEKKKKKRNKKIMKTRKKTQKKSHKIKTKHHDPDVQN